MIYIILGVIGLCLGGGIGLIAGLFIALIIDLKSF